MAADFERHLSRIRELEAEGRRQRAIFDSAVDFAIIATDRDGKVTDWNTGAERILGWSAEEMHGHTAERFFTPDDRANGRPEKEMLLSLRDGRASDERWHLRKDGSRFWASGELMPLREDGGEHLGFVKVLRDRTAEQRGLEALRAADDRLRESEDHLRHTVELNPQVTWTADPQGNITSYSNQWLELTGQVPGEPDDSGWIKALHPDDVEPTLAAFSACLASGEPIDVDYRIWAAVTREHRWMRARAYPRRDEQGRIVRWYGVVEDDHDRKAAELALRESEEQFRAFAQAVPNHLWASHPNGELYWFNEQVYAYSGAKHGALDGSAWSAILHPDDLPAAAAAWARSLETGQVYEAEFRIRHAEGTYRWFLVRAEPVRSPDGAIVRWIGTNTDIHERKLAETESARERDQLWTLSEDMLARADYSGMMSAVSPAWTRVLGWSETELLARPYATFMHPEDEGRTLEGLGRMGATGQATRFENRIATSDGGWKSIEWVVAPEPDGINFIAVGRDLSAVKAREAELELAQEALRQSQKLEAIGQLTGGVAHDFNNLLTVIRGSIDLMRRGTLPEERRQRHMQAISDTVTRATRLTQQLLAFARRQSLQPEVINVGRSMRTVGEMLATLSGSRIEIIPYTPAEPCFVNVDPSQFDTALVNMAVNARDAMGGEGTLTIRVKPVSIMPAIRNHPAVRGEFVAVSLTDTGSGIPAEQLDQIFEPFFTTKAAGAGTGLGLSQVFGFAKQSGGEVMVESLVGRGTTFTLYLPRAEAPAEVKEPAAEEEAVEGNGACVLLVEDNEEVGSFATQALNDLGYVAVWALNASEALAELEKDAARFDVVFTDVIMPGMNGIDLAQEIRRRYPSLPVVLTSGYSGVLAQGGTHGFELVHKPYSVEGMSRALGKAAARGEPRIR